MLKNVHISKPNRGVVCSLTGRICGGQLLQQLEHEHTFFHFRYVGVSNIKKIPGMRNVRTRLVVLKVWIPTVIASSVVCVAATLIEVYVIGRISYVLYEKDSSVNNYFGSRSLRNPCVIIPQGLTVYNDPTKIQTTSLTSFNQLLHHKISYFNSEKYHFVNHLCANRNFIFCFYAHRLLTKLYFSLLQNKNTPSWFTHFCPRLSKNHLLESQR